MINPEPYDEVVTRALGHAATGAAFTVKGRLRFVEGEAMGEDGIVEGLKTEALARG